jgi:hypothetical protein
MLHVSISNTPSVQFLRDTIMFYSEADFHVGGVCIWPNRTHFFISHFGSNMRAVRLNTNVSPCTLIAVNITQIIYLVDTWFESD